MAMKVAFAQDERFLEREGVRLKLSPEDWLHLLRMTPLGRRVYFQNKGKKLRLENKDAPEAEILLLWTRLPVKEWAFSCLPS